jgi:hypothetical protein
MRHWLSCFMLLALSVHCASAYAQSALSDRAPLRDASAAAAPQDAPLDSHQAAVLPDAHVPEVIARQRDALSIERAAVMQAYEAQKKLCWQKFAVNPCLNDARRQRRQALHPLQEQELSLNAQERLWRTEQRNLRLQNKALEPKDPL